jgi:molybdopterin-synthase adenylyltransferase
MAELMVDRDIRQRSLVPPERLAAVTPVVIGVGTVGRQVAWQLAAVGVSRLYLFDDDAVAIENLAPQGYAPTDLGTSKVDATARWCRQLRPDLGMVTYPQRFARTTSGMLRELQEPIVFMCVDSIATRRIIWNAVRFAATLVIDGRIAAEVIRVLASDRPAIDSHYESTLFDSGDAYVGACTARSTIYSATIAAGLMVGQLARWLRGLSVVADQTLNLLAAELTVNEPAR